MADPVLHAGIAPRQAVLTLLPAFCCRTRAQVQETHHYSISPMPTCLNPSLDVLWGPHVPCGQQIPSSVCKCHFYFHGP